MNVYAPLPTATEENSCRRKIAHPTVEEAQEHAERLHREGYETVVVYGPCLFCGKYHVGHRPKTHHLDSRYHADRLREWARRHNAT